MLLQATGFAVTCFSSTGKLSVSKTDRWWGWGQTLFLAPVAQGHCRSRGPLRLLAGGLEGVTRLLALTFQQAAVSHLASAGARKAWP